MRLASNDQTIGTSFRHISHCSCSQYNEYVQLVLVSGKVLLSFNQLLPLSLLWLFVVLASRGSVISYLISPVTQHKNTHSHSHTHTQKSKTTKSFSHCKCLLEFRSPQHLPSKELITYLMHYACLVLTIKVSPKLTLNS